jgi:GH18 family chitinase
MGFHPVTVICRLAGLAKLQAPLITCTHLVYGFAVIDGGNYKLVPLDVYQELDSGRGYYRAVTSIKKRYPGLNMLLSVGGLADPVKVKYLTMLNVTEWFL